MKRVLLLMANGAEILETAAFIDVLGWAGTYGEEPIEVVMAGLHEEIRCTFHVRIKPDVPVSEIKTEAFDALAIPGGFEIYGFYEDAFSETFGRLIREFNDQGKPIASICVGALAVGNSGALKGRCATTYHLMEGSRRKELAAYEVEIKDESIVCDDNIITSTSPATAVNVAFKLLETLTSRKNADMIRELMGFN